MKFIKPILIILICIPLFSLIYFSSLKNCRSIYIFKSYLDFGLNHINGCVSISNLKSNTKVIFSDNPIFYELSRKFYNHFIKDRGEFKYNILTNIDEPPQKFKPLKHRFVEGILQNEGYDYLFKKNNLNINNNIVDDKAFTNNKPKAKAKAKSKAIHDDDVVNKNVKKQVQQIQIKI